MRSTTWRLLLALLAVVTLAAGCLADEESTGPVEDHEECVTNDDGEVVVNVDNTVVDGLCLDGGVLIISADNVEVKNSQLTGAPPEFFEAVHLTSTADGTNLHNNIVDCGGIEAEDIDAASQGFASEPGSTDTEIAYNEIRGCTDGVQLFSDSFVHNNWTHTPDNCFSETPPTCDLHADGVQFSAEGAEGPGIHDVLYEWNVTEFAAASSAFQFHNSPNAGQTPERIVVRYNLFLGGAFVVRIPGDNSVLCAGEGACQGVDLEFYGNRIDNVDVSEFGLCSSGGTDAAAIEVWGHEHGSTDHTLGTARFDDDNLIHEDGFGTTVIDREDC
jgi:hypothetical protein